MTRIKVTAKDIRDGTRRSCTQCPIVLAIQKLTTFKVTVSTAWVEIEGWWERLPFEARLFICNFDTEQKVRPFSFTLNIPKEYLKP